MSYADYLDYWMKEYFEINFKYTTAKRYKDSFTTLKKELGQYKLCDITPYLLNKTLLGLYIILDLLEMILQEVYKFQRF